MTGTIVHQGLFGRLLNFGDIAFTGAGSSGKVKMSGVSDILTVKAIVENQIQNNRAQAKAIQTSQEFASASIPTSHDQIPSNSGTKFCQFCGFKMPSPAMFCPSCGKQQL